MAIRRSRHNVMTEDFGLRDNPFSSIGIYNVDAQHTYVPEMYGKQLDEFYEKFFIRPLENESHRQLIGAIWSAHGDNRWGKGFGKSMLMAEESKRICADMGASMLHHMEVHAEDIDTHPILSGYSTFDLSKGINSFPAVLLDAVAFILSQSYNDNTVHQELRARVLSNLDSQDGYEGTAIYEALGADLRRYSGLNVQLGHHTINRFMLDLAHDDTNNVVSFLRHEIGPRIKATQGFNFVHVFNAFARMAGIVYIAYFIDQIENFARFAVRRHERDVKIIREAMCQTSPTADMSSFFFQMHVHAAQAIQNFWQIEDLPSIDVNVSTNSGRILNILGLGTREARVLVERYLADYRVEGFIVPDALHPFSREIVEAVRDASAGNPRKMMTRLGDILDKARDDGRAVLDLAYVEPLIDEDHGAEEENFEDEYENPTR